MVSVTEDMMMGLDWMIPSHEERREKKSRKAEKQKSRKAEKQKSRKAEPVRQWVGRKKISSGT